MDTFSHYRGTTQDFTDYMAVTPRPARIEEDPQGKARVYEIQIDRDLQLKALHTQLQEGGDEDISVEMLYKGRQIFSQRLKCVQIILDRQDNSTFMVLHVGSTNLHIHKNPWRLHVTHSNRYDMDDDYP